MDVQKTFQENVYITSFPLFQRYRSFKFHMDVKKTLLARFFNVIMKRPNETYMSRLWHVLQTFLTPLGNVAHETFLTRLKYCSKRVYAKYGQMCDFNQWFISPHNQCLPLDDIYLSNGVSIDTIRIECLENDSK